MQREEFERLVRREAPLQSAGTLRHLSLYLEALAASRSRQPTQLQIGAVVHASHLDCDSESYGVVVELTETTCLLQTPERDRPELVVLDEQHVRVLSAEEWGHIEPRLRARRERA